VDEVKNTGNSYSESAASGGPASSANHTFDDEMKKPAVAGELGD